MFEQLSLTVCSLPMLHVIEHVSVLPFSISMNSKMTVFDILMLIDLS